MRLLDEEKFWKDIKKPLSRSEMSESVSEQDKRAFEKLTTEIVNIERLEELLSKNLRNIPKRIGEGKFKRPTYLSIEALGYNKAISDCEKK